MFQRSNIQMFQCSNVPMFKCSNVLMFKIFNVLMFQCSNVGVMSRYSDPQNMLFSVLFFSSFFRNSLFCTSSRGPVCLQVGCLNICSNVQMSKYSSVPMVQSLNIYINVPMSIWSNVQMFEYVCQWTE